MLDNKTWLHGSRGTRATAKPPGLMAQLTSPAAGWVPTQGAMPKELLEEASALASLMTLLLDVPELVAAAPNAQLQTHSPWTQLLRCSPACFLLTWRPSHVGCRCSALQSVGSAAAAHELLVTVPQSMMHTQEV